MLQPSASHIRELLDFKLLVPALRDAFVEGTHVPSRHVHSIEGDGGSGTSLLMPAWSDRGFYGVKIVNVFPRNRESGLPGLHSTYILYNAKTGEPLALLDGNEITSRRTAAASALAASFLAREDATHLLVIGAGRVGSLMAQAMAAVRNIARVVLWDIQREAARRCEAALRDQGFRVEVAEDLESAVRNADIVTCATLAERPLVQAQWLAPGSHLDLIGSFTPQMTEAAPACFAHASVWIDTEEALRKSGDLLNALQSGDLTFQALGGTLEDLCRHRGGRRARQDERTVFKAVGTALEDLAAATLVYHQLSR